MNARVASQTLRCALARIVSAGLIVFLSAQAGAQGVDDEIPVYRAPQEAVDKTRIGGASRGAASEITLNVLAPEHTGLTASGQPTLFWHLSDAWGARVEVSIADEESIDPVFERALNIKPDAKIESLALDAHGVVLEPGVEYQWSVTVLPESEDAVDLFASGTIKRIESPAGLDERVLQSKQTAPNIYAQEGLWYEAIMSLSELIDAEPKNQKLREKRAALMEQVGLHDVAAYDRDPGRH